MYHIQTESESLTPAKMQCLRKLIKLSNTWESSWEPLTDIAKKVILAIGEDEPKIRLSEEETNVVTGYLLQELLFPVMEEIGIEWEKGALNHPNKYLKFRSLKISQKSFSQILN